LAIGNWHLEILTVSAVKQSLASKTTLVLRLVAMKRTNRSVKGLVNTEELGRAVKRRREELGLSLRDVANETSVSASTLSRIENGTGKPDADNIARLTAWLDVPMERILSGRDPKAEESKAVIYYPQEPTPQIVEAHLRADKNLTPETAAALAEVFRVAYNNFSRNDSEKTAKKRR
jgi:transcriptional regulator with XRE-family HTH domain